jgi:hypothetical protein
LCPIADVCWPLRPRTLSAVAPSEAAGGRMADIVKINNYIVADVDPARTAARVVDQP